MKDKRSWQRLAAHIGQFYVGLLDNDHRLALRGMTGAMTVMEELVLARFPGLPH